ncbi:DUF192 domain-containing protein [soil metagenome]
MTGFLPRSPRTGATCRTALLLVLIAGGGCRDADNGAGNGDYVPLVSFDTASAALISGADTISITVEIAEREEQRSYGLMERATLPDDAGMIFIYGSQQRADAGFWMYRTRIPLDIAFLDANGTILTILGMEPCPDMDPRGCRTYPPGVPYFSALEVNRGYLAARGIGIGDRVVLHR